MASRWPLKIKHNNILFLINPGHNGDYIVATSKGVQVGLIHAPLAELRQEARDLVRRKGY